MSMNFEDSDISSDIIKKEYASVLDEILDEAVLDLCFKVHRAMKLGYLCTDEYNVKDGEFVKYDLSVQNNVEANPTGNSKKGSANGTIYIECPKCNKSMGSSRFTKHMVVCFSGSDRSSKRLPTQQYQNDDDDDDDDDDDSSNDSSFGQTSKRRKKKPGKNSPARGFKSKRTGDTIVSSSSDTSITTQIPQDMSMEQRKAFLNQKCGVISSKTGKMCNNTFNCSTHNNLMRREVRSLLLQGEVNNGVHIDVDTADGDTHSHSRYNSIDLIPRSPFSTESSISSSSTSGSVSY